MASRLIMGAVVSFVAIASAGPVVLAQLPAPATAVAPTTRATIEETSLGSVAGYDAPRNIAVDYDANHVAFIGVRDKQQFVVLDGKSGPAYDWIIPDSLEFSPKGGHLGYLVQTSAQTLPVIDGQVGKGVYSVAHNKIFWSPDGKRSAIAVEFQGGGGEMVVDGVEGPKYDSADYPVFSPDAQHVAYIAKRGTQQFAVLDGKESKAYDAIGRLSFSPNGKHLTYEVASNGKAILVLDNQEGKAYDAIKIGPGFSYDGSRLVAVAAQAGKLLVLVNGRESGPYEALLLGDFVLSPDGKRIGYAIKQGSQQFVIIDGVAQPAFDHVAANSLSFSPDSKRFVYVAGDKGDGHEFVVVDGVRGKDCDGVLDGTPFFSPDSKRVAYAAIHKMEKKWNLVVDGIEGKAYDQIEKPMTQMFSPDSRRIAYRAILGNQQITVIDGVECAPVEASFVDTSKGRMFVFDGGYIAFGPDSKHVAYMHKRDDKTYVLSDGVEVAGPYNPASPKMQVIFDDASTAHIVATRKDEFVRVKIKFGP